MNGSGPSVPPPQINNNSLHNNNNNNTLSATADIDMQQPQQTLPLTPIPPGELASPQSHQFKFGANSPPQQQQRIQQQQGVLHHQHLGSPPLCYPDQQQHLHLGPPPPTGPTNQPMPLHLNQQQQQMLQQHHETQMQQLQHSPMKDPAKLDEMQQQQLAYAAAPPEYISL